VRLVVVGCSGSFPGPDSAASSYLVQARDSDGRTWSLLLDLGSGALGPLQRHVDPRTLDAVALSHLHADHVADLAVLNVLLRYHPDGRRAPLPVYGPAGSAERVAHLAGKDPATAVDGQFEFHDWTARVPVQVGPLTIEPIPVAHPIASFGVRVTGPSERDAGERVTLTYTGDTDDCEGLDVLARDTDLLLAEAGYVEGRDDALRGVHLTGRRAADVARRAGAKRLVLTHVPPWNDPAVPATEAMGVYAGPIAVAAPGAVYPL
jgi:ribonuclease BN (tRNA processing enzyme)